MFRNGCRKGEEEEEEEEEEEGQQLCVCRLCFDDEEWGGDGTLQVGFVRFSILVWGLQDVLASWFVCLFVVVVVGVDPEFKWP